MKKYINYLLIPGIILAIAGLVAGSVSSTWPPLYLGLLVGGIAILVLWLAFILYSNQGFWRRRSTEVGTNALISILAVLAILGLVNFLALRYSLRIDLTENQLFTLSPQSQEIVKKLPEPLKVWVFEPQTDSDDQKLLENYRRNGSKFAFEFVDPQVKVGLAQKFNVKSLGDVYLEYGNKRQYVQTLSPSEGLSEIKLTNAIQKIQRDRPQTFYFLQGHGEATLQASEGGLSQAIDALKEKGDRVEPLNLAERSAIPGDATAIAIAGPKRALFAGEVKLLKDYLDLGGRLLILLDPKTRSGLEPLLKDWGIQLDDRLVVDASGAGSAIGYGPATALVTNYGNHPITKDFQNGISVYPLARPISTKKIPGIDAVALLITNAKSWAESNLTSEEVKFDPGQDIQGPLDLGVALVRTQSEAGSQSGQETAKTPETPAPSPTGESKTPTPSRSPTPVASKEQVQPAKTESRLVVFGNSTFATNGWFEQQLNGDVFLNSVNWLAGGDEQTLSIRPKEPKNRRINLTPLQAGLISWLALLIVPLFGFVLAALTWWRRR